ncbi:hypothetical protein EDC04DRAFT_2970718 [Pisolithus marmoratus]|nr:hypothetical protein EDC04DRAFT_2970718 [Pisolithus marmoratus]
MSPSPATPWPARTPPPSSYLRSNREPNPRSPAPPLLPRQDGTTISDSTAVADARVTCQLYANNNDVTCFPPAGEQVYQHQWAAVVCRSTSLPYSFLPIFTPPTGNSRRPQLTQTNLVNLYLFNADTQQPLFSITDVQNPTGAAGEYNLLVNDSWFGTLGATWQSGQNLSYPFYWIFVRTHLFYHFSLLSEAIIPFQRRRMPIRSCQLCFRLLLPYHPCLSSHHSPFIRPLSTASIASASQAGVLSPSSSVQPQQNDSVFPHWAIAVIVVLGFLAIVGGGVLAWLFLRWTRRRTSQSNRGSMGSASPMMADAHHQQSPNLPFLVAGALGRTSSEHHRPPSVVSRDGASEAHSAGDSGLISTADAAIMADAFRKALRKPDFAAAPVEENDDGKDEDDVINRELAEEGRDIRSVGSSRGVRVETLSETGDIAQDH